MEPENTVDVDALMDEVRRRVEERRAAGEYGDLDDTPTFAELALFDDLAASANRVGAAARIPGIVPELFPKEPGRNGSGGNGSTDQIETAPVAPAAGVGDRAIGLARRVVRKAVGDRIDQVIVHIEEFFAAAADNSRVSAERVIALERRVDELERHQAGGEPGSE